VIVGISYKDTPFSIDGDATGQGKFAGASAISPHKEQKSTFPVENLEIPVARVNDINVVVSVNGNAFWPRERTGRIPYFTDAAFVAPGMVENLDHEIHGIGHINIVISANCDIRREIERFSGVIPWKVPDKSVMNIKNLQFMCQHINDKFIAATVNSDPRWTLELTSQFMDELAIPVVLEYFGTPSIGNIHIPVPINGHPSWTNERFFPRLCYVGNGPLSQIVAMDNARCNIGCIND